MLATIIARLERCRFIQSDCSFRRLFAVCFLEVVMLSLRMVVEKKMIKIFKFPIGEFWYVEVRWHFVAIKFTLISSFVSFYHNAVHE